jgi:predicted RNA binding protein YcfA (HicA-like mRNA interferase family)
LLYLYYKNAKRRLQKGSHGKFWNSAGKVVILPMPKKEIPEGTLRSILRQAGIDKNVFIKLPAN